MHSIGCDNAKLLTFRQYYLRYIALVQLGEHTVPMHFDQMDLKIVFIVREKWRHSVSHFYAICLHIRTFENESPIKKVFCDDSRRAAILKFPNRNSYLSIDN